MEWFKAITAAMQVLQLAHWIVVLRRGICPPTPWLVLRENKIKSCAYNKGSSLTSTLLQKYSMMFYNSQLLPYALRKVRSFSSQNKEGTYGYVQRLDIFNRRESQLGGLWLHQGTRWVTKSPPWFWRTGRISFQSWKQDTSTPEV